ncbi:hypothetical protein [Halolamina sp.]|uniref:DUF7310 family coiled-coil domain-containing protein n=1 Tax=Halolamina sp. TaxID=1940283 RepID=UPI000223B81E|nr:hypothetical protein Halar_0783 [halophilic archaeon DL31]
MPPNPDQESLERRLDAVEAAVSADESALEVAQSSSDTDISSRIEALETRIEELEAAVQAVRGFLGGVDAVNESVESRADAAIAAVERLEQRLDEEGVTVDSRPQGGENTSDANAKAGSADTQDQTLPERLRDQW